MNQSLKYITLIVLAYFSFIIGFQAWDPIVRNQPKNLDIISASNLVNIKTAVRQYYLRNKNSPTSIDDLVKSCILPKENSVDGFGREFVLQKLDEYTIKVYSTEALIDITEDFGNTTREISIIIHINEE